MLEMFIVLNEKGKKKYQGERSTNNLAVKEGGRQKKHTYFFIFLFFIFLGE